MRFTKVSEKEFVTASRHYRKTKLAKALDDFLESGYSVAELDISDYACAASAVGTFKRAIARHNKTRLASVVSRHGKVYLINLEKISDEVKEVL